MSHGVNGIISAGTLKITITAKSNVLTYELQITEISPGGTQATPVRYQEAPLAQGVALPLVSQHAYMLDLQLVREADPCTVNVIFEHNGTVIWETECTKFGNVFSGQWKYTIQ